MNENEMDNAFRIWALELLVSFQYTAMHLQMPDPYASLEMIRSGLKTRSKMQTFPNLDPVESDLASSKIEDALDRLLAIQKTMLDQARKPTGR